MDFDREAIADFFIDEAGYFASYSTVAQDPERCTEMHRFYGPDITVTTYYPEKTVIDREQFLKISSSHPRVRETLTPLHWSIDEREGVFAVVVKGTFTLEGTGEVVEQEFGAHYRLAQEGDGGLRIEKLWIFAEWIPPGKKSFVDFGEAFREATS